VSGAPVVVAPPARHPLDTILPMTVPDRRGAGSVLRSLNPPAKFVRHACAVADVAAFLALRADQRGHPVDRRLTEAAALLHDVDKLASAGAPAHLRHGEGSAAWLEMHGYPELAPVVRDHPVTRLAEPAFDGWARTAPLESRIVAYADKRAAQRLAPMAKRFARWRRKYPPGSDRVVKRGGGAAWSEGAFERAERHAAELELEVCRAAGVRPDQVERLRWARRALREVDG
jgi:HD domain